MSENLNAIINARLQGREGLFRLTITDGKFSSVTAQDATERAKNAEEKAEVCEKAKREAEEAYVCYG